MPKTRCAVRLNNGHKAQYEVDLTDLDQIRAAFKSELPEARVVLISVPNCGSQIDYVEPTEAA